MNYKHLTSHKSSGRRYFGVYVERPRLLAAARVVCPAWGRELALASHPFGPPCFLGFRPAAAGGFEPAYVRANHPVFPTARLSFEFPAGLADAVLTDADRLALRADRAQAERLARQAIPGFITLPPGMTDHARKAAV